MEAGSCQYTDRSWILHAPRVNPGFPRTPVVRGSKLLIVVQYISIHASTRPARKPVDGEDQDRDDQQPAFEDGAPDDRRIAQFHEIEDHQRPLK